MVSLETASVTKACEGICWHLNFPSPGYSTLRSRCLGLQINEQATTTNSESNQRKFKRYKGGHPEQAQGYNRSDAHDRAHLRRHVIDGRAVDKFPNEKYIGRVHQEEYRRVEGNRLRRQFAHGHPSGGERKQRHRKQMCEIEPHQAGRRLC